jgi:trigger factor
MEYQVEQPTPVKRTIKVQVPAEEVQASLQTTIALYQRDAQMDGFRKGKVPMSVIEGRFKKQIYTEATTDLVNLHINQIMTEQKFTPVSRIDFDGDELERGEDFSYALNFEVMPEFELPDYEGLAVEEEEPEVDEDEVQAVFERIRNQMAELVEEDEVRQPVDGDAVVINFAAYDDGKAIDGVHAENFQMVLGEGQALEAFEDIVKTMTRGEIKEEDLTFPEDFLNPALAGKTVRMMVKLVTLKKKVLPELDDELAQKAGGFTDLEQMRLAVRKSYLESRTQLYRSMAQKKILDQLMARAEFPVPETLFEGHLNHLVQNFINRLEQRGKSLESTGKTEEDLRAEFRSDAESMARSEVFLLTVARKEVLEVSEQEIDFHFRQMAARTGQDFMQLKKYHMDNDLIIPIHNRMLADKAMELLYNKAEIKKVPAGSLDAPQEGKDKESASAGE